MKHFDWPKIFANAAHAVLIFGSCYAAVNPEWAWAIPAFQMLGQVSPAPNMKVGGA